MITSGFVWGFLADTLGRKKLLVIGYFLDFAMVSCSAFSQTYEMLASFKYLGGFMYVLQTLLHSFLFNQLFFVALMVHLRS